MVALERRPKRPRKRMGGGGQAREIQALAAAVRHAGQANGSNSGRNPLQGLPALRVERSSSGYPFSVILDFFFFWQAIACQTFIVQPLCATKALRTLAQLSSFRAI
jgi:hypothetical protein